MRRASLGRSLFAVCAAVLSVAPMHAVPIALRGSEGQALDALRLCKRPSDGSCKICVASTLQHFWGSSATDGEGTSPREVCVRMLEYDFRQCTSLARAIMQGHGVRVRERLACLYDRGLDYVFGATALCHAAHCCEEIDAKQEAVNALCV